MTPVAPNIFKGTEEEVFLSGSRGMCHFLFCGCRAMRTSGNRRTLEEKALSTGVTHCCQDLTPSLPIFPHGNVQVSTKRIRRPWIWLRPGTSQVAAHRSRWGCPRSTESQKSWTTLGGSTS